jgi:hypothetical protein
VTTRREVSTKTERNPQSRTADKRMQPFVSVLLVAMLAVPAFCFVFRAIVAYEPSLMWLVVWLELFLFGAVGPGAAIGIGYRVTKRLPFVVWHVALTIELFAIASSLSALLGWSRPYEGNWWFQREWRRLVDIFTLPGEFVVIYIIGALLVTLSWWLYRIDAFRAAATGEGNGGDGGLAQLLGWPTGATIRPGSITSDEHAVEAIVDHKGVPVKKVQDSLPAVVEQAGAIRGRSTVIPGELGGQSTIRLVKSDPLTEWKPWPGLSHPGGSFAYPFRTAYYTNGKTQWFSFAMTPSPKILPRSKVAPDFQSMNDAHFGRQGATRSGKSGDNAIELAEALSRRDAIVCVVNTAKLMQDVGWAMDFVGLAADDKPKAHLLFDRIQALGEHRSAVMGDPRLNGRHRTWTPLTYQELGFAALLIEVDEGDQVLHSSIATWLSTKGLSLGIYVSTMISRAATDGMASTLRSAITQWKAFGAGQAYDGGFVLSDETIAAGADVGALSTRFPGSQYLDKAQGVDETLYPEMARSYRTERDFSDLREAVSAARATFTPATFTPGELRILGPAAKMLSPRAILIGAYAQADAGRDPDTAPAATDHTNDEGIDMQTTLTLDEDGNRPHDTGDPEIDALLAKPRQNFSDLAAEYGELPPPNEPLPSKANPDLPDVTLVDGRPERSEVDTAAEFDAALIRLAEKGVTEFQNKDVMAEMHCDPNPSFVTRRFKGLCDEGKYVMPPGLTVERVPTKAGRYLLTRLAAPGVLDAE